MVSQNTYAEECLKTLQRIAEDIPSGVREEHIKKILKVKAPQEVLTLLQNIITCTCKQQLQRFWDEFQIADKLTHLKELEINSPSEKAWRPTTGEVDMNPIIADCLLKQKMELMKEMHLLKKESEAAKSQLMNFPDRTRRQLEELDRIESAFEQKVMKLTQKMELKKEIENLRIESGGVQSLQKDFPDQAQRQFKGMDK